MEVKEASARYLPHKDLACPPGYKQTEVGLIPEDWNAEYFTTIGEIVDGDRGVNYPNKSELKDAGYCLFLNAGNVTKRGFRFSDCEFITEKKDRKLSKGKLVRFDIVLTTRGTVGNIAYYSKKVPFDNIRINSGMVILRNNSPRIDAQFVYSVLCSNIFSLQVEKLTFGSAQPQLTVKGIGSVKIPLPPTKGEQEAIAKALSDTDALIESLEQLIAKKRHIKKGAMQELLTGKRRLPGFSGEWEIKPLGDVAEIIMGQSPSSANYNNRGDGLPLIQGNADIAERKTIKRVFTTEITKRGRHGDVLMSVRAPVGEISLATFDVCLGRGVCAIRGGNEFLYHALIAKEPTWASLSKGSTFDSVNSTDVKAFEIEMPLDENEQTAIATLLSDIDDDIATLENKLAKTRQLKQGMMHELLTGRIRLVKPGSKE